MDTQTTGQQFILNRGKKTQTSQTNIPGSSKTSAQGGEPGARDLTSKQHGPTVSEQAEQVQRH